ncbi:BaiN/RdsA family NAD(P)/FAD-dependent oxidoreductase [Clostridium sp. DL1XJH146]
MYHDLLIIGGGPSGLTASITAKDLGIDVAIIEKNSRIGKKILTTGNGRCNLTNRNLTNENYNSSLSSFPNKIIENYSPSTIEDFFSSIGLSITTLDEGKMYPMSLQASSVVDVFLMSIEERQIPVYCNQNIINISKSKETFIITCGNEEKFTCSKLLICTGGKSYPKTGSDGSGYLLAKKLGHTIIYPKPALVQLKLDYPKLKSISGVKFDGFASLLVNNDLIKKDFGEILFTDYGISGPPILQLSRPVSLEISKNSNLQLAIDMMPNYSEKDLYAFLENQWGVFSYRSIFHSLIGIINKKIIPIILKDAGIGDIHKPCWSLEYQEKKNLLKLIKEWKFKITATNGFNNAQVTVGGVNASEVNSYTLESKITPGLYLAGEILDIDGDCGGYNLHWAWASGMQSAKSIASSLRE